MTGASIAVLPMYDWPELREATDDLWAMLRDALRSEGLPAPDCLARPPDPEALWTSPDLLVGQTCGWPLVHRLGPGVEVVATPHYAVEGCDGPHYSSALIVRTDDPAASLADLAGRRAAINAPHSQSGMAALRHAVAALKPAGGFFSRVVETGAHRASVAAVASGAADIAAIDAVAWHWAQRFDPEITATLRVLGLTPRVPGLPFIVSAALPEKVHSAIRMVVTERLNAPETVPVRAPLAISGASALTRADYRIIGELELADKAAGYPMVA